MGKQTDFFCERESLNFITLHAFYKCLKGLFDPIHVIDSQAWNKKSVNCGKDLLAWTFLLQNIIHNFAYPIAFMWKPDYWFQSHDLKKRRNKTKINRIFFNKITNICLYCIFCFPLWPCCFPQGIEQMFWVPYLTTLFTRIEKKNVLKLKE